MTNEGLFRDLGYVVRLVDNTLNPVAVEADRILCEKYPQGVHRHGVMAGTAVAEAWKTAREIVDGRDKAN